MRTFLIFSLLSAAGLSASHATTPGAPLAGRWQLAEQAYESTRQDPQVGGQTLRLGDGAPVLVVRVGPLVGVEATIRHGARGPESAWPALVADGSPVALEVLERVVDVHGGRMRAHYRIAPPDGEGWTLDITEEYAVDHRGDLTGRMHVRMLDDGEARGGYALRRRFERRP